MKILDAMNADEYLDKVKKTDAIDALVAVAHAAMTGDKLPDGRNCLSSLP